MDCEDPWHQRPDIKLTVTVSQLVQRRQAKELMAGRVGGGGWSLNRPSAGRSYPSIPIVTTRV